MTTNISELTEAISKLGEIAAANPAVFALAMVLLVANYALSIFIIVKIIKRFCRKRRKSVHYSQYNPATYRNSNTQNNTPKYMDPVRYVENLHLKERYGDAVTIYDDDFNEIYNKLHKKK